MSIPIFLRRLVVVAILFGAGAAGLAIGAASAPAPAADPAVGAVARGTTSTMDDPVPTTAAEPVPTTTAPVPGPTTTVPVADPEPVPEPEPDPAHLIASDGAIELPVNVFSGSFEVTNDGGQGTAWTWVGDPRITVSAAGGVLAAGETVVIDFDIDAGELEWGANLLANCITYDEGAVDVWITATPFKLLIPVELHP